MSSEEPGYDRRLLVLATIAGMGAIVALPLSADPRGAGLSVPLVFALPLTLAVVGRMRGVPWLVGVAFVVLFLLGAIVVLRLEPLAPLALIALLLGPLVAVVAVGVPLRQVDVIAGTGFLGCGTLAVVGGFAVAGNPGSVALVLGLGLVGITVVLFRVGRRATG